jgi:hypothetical protein
MRRSGRRSRKEDRKRTVTVLAAARLFAAVVGHRLRRNGRL